MATPVEIIPPTEEVAKPDAEITKPQDAAAATTTPPSADGAAAQSVPEARPADEAPAPPTAASPEQIPTPAAESDSPPREREMVADPRLAVLRAMFPDFDDSLLQSVLDSVNGNTDRAIDALLGMSDPDFTSEQPDAPPVEVPQTQEQLDEQLARSLMLEDEREQHAWRAQQQPPPPQRPEGRRVPSDGPPEKDTMQEIQEQFNKFAESGKKTFGTLFSKVKAKIQEFDQPAGQSSSSGAAYGAGGDTYPYEANQNPYPVAHQQSQQQRQQAQTQAQMPAYYDPNAPSSNPSPPGSATAMGYDTGAPVSMSPPGSGPSPPPSTNTGAPPIDGGKLGMLPKRPVSLLRTNSPPTAAPHPSSDEDELEYAENPFEEGPKK
ncbi:hypothetical protein FB451DRAFT_1260475 [Mycena latifolia]|nr:hypothetical protein FB451DRAFT_1260475 [Mycena latifolia]